MEANPALPVTGTGKRRIVNQSSLPALIAPGQTAQMQQANAILLPKWRAALAKVKTGGGNARILCCGDSTTFGVFSNGTSSGNLKPFSWPTQLAGLLNAAGINAHWNSIACNADNPILGTAQSNGADDSRVTLGSGWSGSIYNGTGGSCYTVNNSSSGNMSFTPTVPVDTFTVFYVTQPGASILSYTVSGGGSGTINTGASNATTSVNITCPLGINTLNLAWSSGTTTKALIYGISAYDSSKSWVDVMNAGWPAAQSADWFPVSGGPYAITAGAGKGASCFSPNLCIIDLGINDIGQTTAKSEAFYAANIQGLIGVLQGLGSDVVLNTFNPVGASGSYANPYPINEQNKYIQKIYGLAAKNNLALIDIYGRMQSYTVSNGNGLMGDQLHPNALGYADKASAIFNAIGNI